MSTKPRPLPGTSTDDRYTTLQRKLEELEKVHAEGKKAVRPILFFHQQVNIKKETQHQTELTNLKSQLAKSKSELRDTTVKLRLAEKQLLAKEKPHKVELEKEKRKLQTLTEQLAQRDAELGGMQAVKEELIRTKDEVNTAKQRETELQAQLNQIQDILERVTKAYGQLASHTVPQSTYDGWRMKNTHLELQIARLQRKLANADGQVHELAWLIRQVKEENVLLRGLVRDAEDEAVFAWSLVPQEQQQQHKEMDLGRLASEIIIDQHERLTAQRTITESLFTLEHEHHTQLLPAYTDAENELLQQTAELDTAQQLFAATTHTVAELKKSLEEWKMQAKTLERQVRDTSAALEKGKEVSTKFRLEAQRVKMAEEGLRAEVEQLTAELMDAERFQEAYYSLHDHVETLTARNALAEDEAAKLSAINAEILGHRNPAQRIMYVERIRGELAEARQKLLASTRANEAMVEVNQKLKEELGMYKSVMVPQELKPKMNLIRVGRPALADLNGSRATGGDMTVDEIM
uniref:Uncharacterized protein n=1 Tax=Moniliophthora roreri TaxID=221103 RepID=A0A0W0F068_MONRR